MRGNRRSALLIFIGDPAAWSFCIRSTADGRDLARKVPVHLDRLSVGI
jgi:hypothetical protein